MILFWVHQQFFLNLKRKSKGGTAIGFCLGANSGNRFSQGAKGVIAGFSGERIVHWPSGVGGRGLWRHGSEGADVGGGELQRRRVPHYRLPRRLLYLGRRRAYQITPAQLNNSCICTCTLLWRRIDVSSPQFMITKSVETVGTNNSRWTQDLQCNDVHIQI